MTEPSSPAWTLDGHSADTVWDNGHRLPITTVVEIDVYEDVGTGEHPDEDTTTLRLVPSLQRLTDDLVQELLELLVGVQGIRPPEVHSVRREVSVPLLAPSTIADDRVEWTINDHLRLVHADRQDMYFALAEDCPGTWAQPQVELTPAQTWLLVRALTTIRCWQFELEKAFSAAATTLRTDLLSAGSTPTDAAAPAAASTV